TAPVYLVVPVQDSKVVDQFLDALDTALAAMVRQKEGGGFGGYEDDFYTYKLNGNHKVRAYGLPVGPAKSRFFLSRVGKGLYLTSRPFILKDLLALEAERDRPGGRAVPSDQGPRGHAMVRLRPQHWAKVLDDYRLAWAENNREACLKNLPPIAHVGRALAAETA